MADKPASRAPRAFAVEPEQPAGPPKTKKAEKPAARKPRAVSEPARIELADDDFFALEAMAPSAPPPPPPKLARRWKIGGWLAAAFSILVSLALGVWTDSLIRALFDRSTWLGWLGLGAAIITALLVLILIGREIAAIWRLRSITAMRNQAQAALETNDPKALERSLRDMTSHFAHHPKTSRGRKILSEHAGEVMDSRDRYEMTERELLGGLDAEARDLVMNAAKRVSVVTAVSPRALVDIGYVLYENIRLIRIISEHYGGRTGTFGTISLARRVIAHLAVTGTVAIGDGIVQQLIGHGLAARLSARLGEGVINGLMTVRVGLSAIDVCRPAPFSALPKPAMREFANVLAKFSTGSGNDEADKAVD